MPNEESHFDRCDHGAHQQRGAQPVPRHLLLPRRFQADEGLVEMMGNSWLYLLLIVRMMYLKLEKYY